MQHLAFELKRLGDFEVHTSETGEEVGTFTGYASVYGNIDRVGDIVVKGAFNEALAKKKKIKVLWQHDTKQPIGLITDLTEDDHGLSFKARLVMDVPQARDAYHLLKAGVIDTTSIGYEVPKGGSEQGTVTDPDTKATRKIRRLKNIRLHEISLVTMAANESACVTGVKSENGDLPSLSDFEKWLREEAGFSRAEAKCVIAKGYAHLIAERSGRVDEDEREAASVVDEPQPQNEPPTAKPVVQQHEKPLSDDQKSTIARKAVDGLFAQSLAEIETLIGAIK